MSVNAPTLESELLRRHDRPGPRYTSYPSAAQFTDRFGPADLQRHLALVRGAGTPPPLSLYVHVPFCLSPCFYCGCNRIITRDVSRGAWYVGQLRREIALLAPLLDAHREVRQLHLGGGTPNFLTEAALAALLEELARRFRLSGDGGRDFSIELDPRSVPQHYPAALARLGFNRVSLGVQDFDPLVQRAVNREQTIEQTLELIDAVRDQGVRSVNVDLIYGLPHQTPRGFRRTLRTVISARPDRLAVYGYAHLPRLFKAQRHIEAAALPDADTRLELLRLAIEELTASGYRYIGMDHFALPDDELVRAQEAGELHRNFMGYTTHAQCDLLGLGVSAISHVGRSFSQNLRELPRWAAALEAGRLPVWRGLEQTADDCIRADVIGQLMCQGRIDIAAMGQRHHIDFQRYFAEALGQLEPHRCDGLVRLDPDHVAVTPAGRLLLRSLAMCFDAYVRPQALEAPPLFSKLV